LILALVPEPGQDQPGKRQNGNGPRGELSGKRGYPPESTRVESRFLRRFGSQLLSTTVPRPHARRVLDFPSTMRHRRICVEPGETSAIESEIENLRPSDGPLEGVTITASVSPNDFAPYVSTSSEPAHDVAVGETRKFTVGYQIAREIPECRAGCAFTILLHTDMITVGSKPDLTDPKNDTTISFIAKKECPGAKRSKK
jgi:hypothetical protein